MPASDARRAANDYAYGYDIECRLPITQRIEVKAASGNTRYQQKRPEVWNLFQVDASPARWDKLVLGSVVQRIKVIYVANSHYLGASGHQTDVARDSYELRIEIPLLSRQQR